MKPTKPGPIQQARIQKPMSKDIKEQIELATLVGTPEPTALKFDAGKTDWSILPIGASKEIIKVFEFGAKKYARGNFKEGSGLEYSRVLNSLLRHTYAFMQGEDLDPETQLSHLAHAGCNIYMLLTYELNKQEYKNDDRSEKVIS